MKIDTDADIFYPTFDPDIFHYAADCASDGTVVVEASTSEQLRISINGNSKLGTNHEVSFDNLSLENDILINVINGSYSSDYVIHCIDNDFPEITITHKEETVDNGFFIISPGPEFCAIPEGPSVTIESSNETGAACNGAEEYNS